MIKAARSERPGSVIADMVSPARSPTDVYTRTMTDVLEDT